ncbi:metal ABC transporter permease [Botrimarina hoheduenensis]|uniref:Manganese transport system membrane protein MntB n=1 Tax=Botrimarina hoheduenensis TaxID=2528000 RepID=A0A5C5VRN9_9BACT|nr:metal ABC transporter permease [Botrimarina hoheduenensis]TWT40837.1 Manganese transport system membrane protein MntB [Botrimarina hoheduenensis]
MILGNLNLSWAIDGWIIAVGVLAAVAAALLGNFLVLRRMSMLGDAISHAVLPGLAAAFLITGSRHSVPMFVGAVIVGILTALLTEWIHHYGQVDEGASMGVVFTSLFAVGLVLIVRAVDHVDLDPGCVLHGAIEMSPLDTWTIAGFTAPRVAVVLSAVLLTNLTFVIVFFKELRISSFDPSLATTVGVNAVAMHYALMTLVAVTAVASFEAVGNILVVAMLIVPPATAYLLTDRLSVMVLLSAVIATISAVVGHLGAIAIPVWLGYSSTHTAGMMAVASGGLLVLAILFAPRQGVIAKWLRQRLIAMEVFQEDVLGLLYRAAEHDHTATLSTDQLIQRLQSSRWTVGMALRTQRQRGLIESINECHSLTAHGVEAAQGLVRAHRLWEHYLVDRAGMDAAAIHLQAERFEHVTDRALRDRLDEETSATAHDPHGKAIPDESGSAD